MKTKNTIAILIIAVLFSCKKNDTGGECTIAAFPAHHGNKIKGTTVYVKFNAEELPSNPTTSYDLKVVGEPNEDNVHVEGLRYGKYYFYAEGYDSTISHSVKGGIAVEIKWSERKKELNVDVPVTE